MPKFCLLLRNITDFLGGKDLTEIEGDEFSEDCTKNLRFFTQ